MEIKGKLSDIGEEVYIKAKLKYIKIDKEGAKYIVTLPDSALNGKGLTESEIMFKMPEPKPAPKIEIREKAKEIVKEAKAEAPTKKRGRPKKATVDSLMRIADEVEAIENGKRFD